MTQVADRLAQADHHRRAGRLQQAQTIYRDILHDDPTNADAWCLLGAACRDRQEYEEAVKAYHKALALTPDAPNIHNSLGIVYAVWRRFAEAEVCFRRALELKPDYARAFNNLGNALSEQRKLDEAVGAYNKARELGYTDQALDESLGLVLTRLGKLDDAEACFRTALAAKPEDGGVLSRLAIVLARKGDLGAAADAMRRALRRPRADADVFLRLGDALTDKGKLDLAVRCFAKALELAPNDHTLLNHLATARLQQGMHDEARQFFRRAIAIRADDQWSRSSLLFVATNDPTADPEETFDDHVTWAKLHAAPPAVPPTFPNERNLNRRLRVGYVSPDFRRHPVGRFMESVLAHHDKNRVEVFCYDEASRAPDEVGDRLRAAAHHWRVTKDKSHADVAAMIRGDRIDVLVDLAGHTGNNRLGALAFRPAPVQVTYLGYPNTSGMGCIDYVLVDSVTQPAAEPAWFVEEPVRLGGGFCVYAPRDDAPPPGPLPAKQNGFVTFGVFHNLSKMNPALLALWARVLKAVPNAKLLVGRNSLSGETQVELRRRFAAADFPDDRVEMRQLVAGPAAFLEAYLPVDIALDTFPWSGHTTACDSLWMGVPVVTLRGQTHAGRMVSSVLTHVGLPDWIAENPDQYVELAAKWAADLDRLAEVRAGLREQMRRSKLCDAQNFTAHLEQAYHQMWKRYCARGPEPAALTDLVARANSLRKANRLDLAEDGYRMVVRADPYHVEAWAWLGSLCHTQNRLDEAVAHYRRALHLRPQDPRSHNSLGILYAKLLRVPAAEACFRQSIELNPEYAKAHNNLGNALSEQGKLDEAAAAFREAARLGFRDATLHLNLAIVESRQGFLDKAAASFQTALELDPANREAQSALLFLQNYDPNVRADRLLEDHRRWGEKQVPAAPPAAHTNEKSPDRPLRIGYVSPDFRSHPVGRFFEPILAAHDRKQVEVYCYDEAPFPPDPMTARLRRVAPNWRISRGQTTAQLADAIRADRIDVLIDLAGHTAHNRLDVFAVKPAPIQVTYLGYPNTTGLPTVDYVLVDSVTAPEDESKRFVEKPFRLDSGFSCFAPRDDAPPVGLLPALRNGYVTFGATHGLIKLNAAVLDLWSELLQAVPDSRLRIARDMLSGEARDRLRRQFIDRGIDERRVELHAPPVGASGYWGLYHDFDIALDTFPWSGHTTACEALWMGVPVITWRGKSHASRMVASVLTHAGLTDWIASSNARYVALAAKRAADVNDLAKLRAGLREHVRNSPLCDATGFTRKLEAAYRAMWRKWCQ